MRTILWRCVYLLKFGLNSIRKNSVEPATKIVIETSCKAIHPLRDYLTHDFAEYAY